MAGYRDLPHQGWGVRHALLSEFAWAIALAARWIARRIDDVLACAGRPVW